MTLKVCGSLLLKGFFMICMLPCAKSFLNDQVNLFSVFFFVFHFSYYISDLSLFCSASLWTSDMAKGTYLFILLIPFTSVLNCELLREESWLFIFLICMVLLIASIIVLHVQLLSIYLSFDTLILYLILYKVLGNRINLPIQNFVK